MTILLALTFVIGMAFFLLAVSGGITALWLFFPDMQLFLNERLVSQDASAAFVVSDEDYHLIELRRKRVTVPFRKPRWRVVEA